MAGKQFYNYILTLRLNGFVGARIIEDENADGVNETGIFIPFDLNCLYETDNHNVYAYGLVTEVEPALSRLGESHTIAQRVPQSHVDWLLEMGLKVPYLGFLRRAHWHNLPKAANTQWFADKMAKLKNDE